MHLTAIIWTQPQTCLIKYALFVQTPTSDNVGGRSEDEEAEAKCYITVQMLTFSCIKMQDLTGEGWSNGR